MATYSCSARPQSIFAVPNRLQVSLQCPTAVSPIFQETLHFLSNKSFRVGMLEINNVFVYRNQYGSWRFPPVNSGTERRLSDIGHLHDLRPLVACFIRPNRSPRTNAQEQGKAAWTGILKLGVCDLNWCSPFKPQWSFALSFRSYWEPEILNPKPLSRESSRPQILTPAIPAPRAQITASADVLGRGGSESWFCQAPILIGDCYQKEVL